MPKALQTATCTIGLSGYGTDDIQPVIDKLADKFVVNVRALFEDRKPGLLVLDVTYKAKGANRNDINVVMQDRFGEQLVYIDKQSQIEKV